MALTQAVINTQTNADVYFYQANGTTPFVGSSPAIYVVRDPTGLLVTSGIASQDSNNPAHWTAVFSIPSSAPATATGQFYTITWTISNSGQIASQTFNFSVVSQIQTDPVDTAVIVLQGSPFTINLTVPYPTLQTLTLRFLNYQGGVVDTPTITTNISNPVQSGNQYIYQIQIGASDSANLVMPNYGVFYYFAYVNYTTPTGSQETNVIMVYVVNTTCIKIMNDMRRYVDRIRNNDVIPQLRITDLDLMHYTIQGVEYLNAIPPSNIGFNLANLPPMFNFYVQKAGAMQLLEAQYLAQGMTSFEFNGQSVQLTQDITQYIMQTIDMIRQDVSSAGLAKNHFTRSGGQNGLVSAIGGVWGPSANLVFRVSPYSLPSQFPSLPFLG